jgi:6-phosphogluconolactonase
MTAADRTDPGQQRWRLHTCCDARQQATLLAGEIGARLRQALQQRGRALLAVSGGKSPLPLFAALREQELDWEHVTVLLADERCVPGAHPDSNAALVRDHLLQGRALSAHWQPFFEQLPAGNSAGWPDASLTALADAANERLAALAWPLDVLVLGMGEDGHTASLFPAAPGLPQALASASPLAWVRPATAPHARLTLTLPTLLAAGTIFLPLAGERKRQVFELACRQPSSALPVSLVLHQAPRPVQVWLAP